MSLFIGILEADRIISTISASVISCPFFDPAAREILSFIKVPPKSLAPIDSRFCAFSAPNFVQETCILSINPCKEVEKISKDFDVLVLKEKNLTGLNSALRKGISWSSENLYDSSLILPGDIIDPETEDIKKILEMGKKSRDSMVICPSTDFGTNALFLSLPTRLNFRFGRNSFFEHQKEAEKISIRSIIAPVDSLKEDLDTGKDLEKFKIRQPKFFQSI